MYSRFFKRFLDFVLSLIAIIVLSPVYLVVALLVRIKLGSPVIFCQNRPGKNGCIFKMYKFRTMTDERNENGGLLPDDRRMTKFGKLLRTTSLDELPELLNVLKGDMSIVGPRPQLVKDMIFMSKDQMRRHCVRQGITGLAQIKGRNNITWEEKIAYDIEYVKSISFSKDISILFSTIVKVLKKADINTEGMETAEDYGDYLLRTHIISESEYKDKLRLLNDLERGIQDGKKRS